MIFRSRLPDSTWFRSNVSEENCEPDKGQDKEMLNHSLEKCNVKFSKAERVDVVTIGAFAGAVAGCLRRFRVALHESSVSCPTVPPIEEVLAGSAALVAVASHPARAIFERLAEIAHDKQRPFLPLVIDESVLRLGPVAVPGAGGCWHCWVARRGQHDGHYRETAALHEFYDHHPCRGPQGFLEPFAWMAAVQIVAILGSREQLEQWAGKIWQLDLFSREVTTGELIGVDGCARCGLNRPLNTRSYAEMQDTLAYLWSEDSSGEKGSIEAGDYSKCGGRW